MCAAVRSKFQTPRITPFQKRVYALCKRVPKGRVTTYKEIGKAIGKRGMVYRAVGMALNRNPYSSVPCHRVVSSDGSIGGFAKGWRAKKQILKKEGIQFVGNNVRNFSHVLFRLR